MLACVQPAPPLRKNQMGVGRGFILTTHPFISFLHQVIVACSNGNKNGSHHRQEISLKKGRVLCFFFHDFGTHHLILLQSNLTQVTGTLVN